MITREREEKRKKPTLYTLYVLFNNILNKYMVLVCYNNNDNSNLKDYLYLIQYNTQIN